MAAVCGWWRFSAIFSGSTCTIQKRTMTTHGTMKSTTSARMSAIVSSASPDRNDAWAGAATSAARTASQLQPFTYFSLSAPGLGYLRRAAGATVLALASFQSAADDWHGRLEL